MRLTLTAQIALAPLPLSLLVTLLRGVALDETAHVAQAHLDRLVRPNDLSVVYNFAHPVRRESECESLSREIVLDLDGLPLLVELGVPPKQNHGHPLVRSATTMPAVNITKKHTAITKTVIALGICRSSLVLLTD